MPRRLQTEGDGRGAAVAAAPAASTGRGAGLREPLRAFWVARSASEQRALAVGAIAVGLLALWLLAVQPAWRTIAAAPAQLDQLDRELESIRASAAEVAALRGVAPMEPAQASQALKAATDRLGDGARLALQGERATLTITGVSAEQLRSWLVEVRTAARARPIEATLARAPQGYSGTLLLVMGAGR